MKKQSSIPATIAVVALCLGASACGGSGGGKTAGGVVNTAPAPGGGGDGPVFHVKVTLTGDVSFTDSYDSPLDGGVNGDAQPHDTCAAIGKNGTSDGTFEVPAPADADTGGLDSGQHAMSIGASVDTYGGAGTYANDQVNDSAGAQFSSTATLPDDGSGDATYNDVNANSSIVVNADGSGTFTFSGWQDAGSHTVSGTLSWTCSG